MTNFQTSKDVEWLKKEYFSDPAKHIVLRKGEVLLEEDGYNEKLFLILNGTLTGYMRDENNELYEAFKSRRDMFVGVYSFFSEQHTSFLTAIADEDGTRVAFIDQQSREANPELFAMHFLPVIVQEIYLRQVLAHQISHQRHAAIKKLYEKEKMATLGQLAAGLAHELNNAVGVLDRNTSWLIQSLQHYLGKRKYADIFEISLTGGQSLSTSALREKRKHLEQKFRISTKTAKQLAKLNIEESQLEKFIRHGEKELDDITMIAEAGIVLHDMNIASSHAAHVVKSVQELGSTQSGKPVATNVYETVSKALTLLQSLTKHVNIVMRHDSAAVVMAISGDLVQVWVNLIKNACESMAQAETVNPTLTVVISENDAAVEVIIGDNGPGIPEEMIAKIFQPSYTTKVNGLSFGLGLGLSIVKKIVHNYKGSITVTSRPGETNFSVHLPKP